MISDNPGATERRLTPRYEIDLGIDLVLEGGSILSVKTRNISSCGIQVICDNWVTGEIEPRGIQSHSISHIRLKVITSLPFKNTEGGYITNKLYASCRIISAQRMSQEEYMLNLAFIDFENGSEKVLDKFLDQFKQKKQ